MEPRNLDGPVTRASNPLFSLQNFGYVCGRQWNDCDKPRNGIVNTLRLLIKRYFQKELKAHWVGQSVAIAESIANNPNKLWKNRSANNRARESKITISESQWHSYFESQFTEPDVNTLEKFET